MTQHTPLDFDRAVQSGHEVSEFPEHSSRARRLLSPPRPPSARRRLPHRLRDRRAPAPPPAGHCSSAPGAPPSTCSAAFRRPLATAATNFVRPAPNPFHLPRHHRLVPHLATSRDLRFGTRHLPLPSPSPRRRHGRRLLQPSPPPVSLCRRYQLLPGFTCSTPRRPSSSSPRGPDSSPCCSSSRSRASSPSGCSAGAPSAAACGTHLQLHAASSPASAANWFDAPAPVSKSGGEGETHAQLTGESNQAPWKFFLGATSEIRELAWLGNCLLLCVCSITNLGSIFERNGLINRICWLHIIFCFDGLADQSNAMN
ncbi:uncharacterized protein [Setaria viridis]|uniref:uncharacterized protein n=1 Tax=Setaria viridis TaxID=4556 RepID=UPI003B3B742E